jgi:UMF1 family MFS transporter
MPAFLERLGLHRPELRAWATYDWAVSSMQTTIMAAVFPIYFVRVASAGLPEGRGAQQLAYANTIAMLLIVLASPILGALADHSAAKKRFLAAFALLGAAACAAMFTIGHGDVTRASALYALAMVGASGSMAFYGALLPHVARADEVDRVSTAGYALGYVGGGLLLALNLAWITQPGAFGLPSGPGLAPAEATLPTRLAFLSVAAWWLAFTIPLLRRVPEPPATREPGEPDGGAGRAIAASFVRLRNTARELRGFKQAGLMLLAFAVYNDGIQTIIKMATAYGTEIGIGQNALIAAILVVQFVGIPFAFVFGALAGRLGAKRAVLLGLALYVVIAILGYRMRTATHFMTLALLVGMVQGGTQALSRSLFASMVPPHRSGEFFGFFGVFEKFSGIFGPLLFALVVQVGGTSRSAILSVIVFFVVGMLLLTRVDVEAGRAFAREQEAEAARAQGAA